MRKHRGATVSAVTIGKDGSNVDYLLVVLALQVSLILDWSRDTYATYHTGRFNQEPQLFHLNQAIQRAPEGDILADEHMALLAINSRPVVFQPFEFKMLSDAGKWDQANFVQSLKDRQYSMILL
jgi:hypothetical protein